jgi:hypothetical protein
MKRSFTISVTTTAYTYEEAQSQVNLLLQMGAFLKDFNMQNLASSFAQHFLLAKLSEYTQGKIDLSHCYKPSEERPNPLLEKPIKRSQRQQRRAEEIKSTYIDNQHVVNLTNPNENQNRSTYRKSKS